jgi:hypothetical protein
VDVMLCWLDPAAKPDGVAQATRIGSSLQTRVLLMMEPATKAFTRKIKSVCQQVSLPTTLFSPGDGTLSILHRSTPAASTCPLRATEAPFLHPRRRLHLQHPLLLLRPPRLQLLRQLLVRASLTTNSVVALVGRDLPLAVMAAPAKLSMNYYFQCL